LRWFAVLRVCCLSFRGCGDVVFGVFGCFVVLDFASVYAFFVVLRILCWFSVGFAVFLYFAIFLSSWCLGWYNTGFWCFLDVVGFAVVFLGNLWFLGFLVILRYFGYFW